MCRSCWYVCVVTTITLQALSVHGTPPENVIFRASTGRLIHLKARRTKGTNRLGPMAHSMLTSLPPELLHNILSGLDTASLSSARLTCRLFSILGLDHFGDEIPLVFHRDKFRALTEIAAHAVLAKRMRSLYYAGDVVSWQEWHE